MKWSDKIEVTNEDNMQLMSRYPDNYFELAIVDPPYGKRPTRGKNGFGAANTIKFQSSDDKWDIKPNTDYFNELFRASKNQIIWGGNYFLEHLKSTNCFIVWDKKTGKNPYADCELAWTSFNSVVKKFSMFWLGAHCKDLGNLIHPTQKPVALYKWLLMNYAKEGDKILDTHLGSGSIALACHELGFELTACELDSEYYDAALKRFKQQTAQLRLAI